MPKYDVFISYSRKDFEEVKSFKEMLESRIPGINIWFDVEDIPISDEYMDRIISGIDNTTNVAFFVSDNSMTSEWTKKEVRYAASTNKKVIPILLKGAKLKGWYLFEFGTVNCVDSTKEAETEILIKDLSKMIGKSFVSIDAIKRKQEELVALKKRIADVETKMEGIKKEWAVTLFEYNELKKKEADLLGEDFAHKMEILSEPKPQIQSPTKVVIKQEVSQNIINGHEYVDLGLSVKWATCNIGANSPEEYGDYFAWGEIKTKSKYTEGNSKTYGKKMKNIAGSPLHDAACANWGDSWRMPTKEEIQELIYKCDWKWSKQNDYNGYFVTGPNGNSIFLPAAGYRDESSLYNAGSYGDYWSSTPNESDSSYAYMLYFDLSSHGRGSYRYRYYGRSVRPVSE